MERNKINKQITKENLMELSSSEKIEMSLNNEDEISQGLLIRRLTELYNNPLEATIREIVSNAVDSVSLNAEKSKTIKIITPSNLNLNLSVKDNGVGMTKETMINIFSKYGFSTKTKDLNQIGAYGLGAKSPLAYTTEFTVESVKDGYKTVAVVSREEHTNYLEIISHTPTAEENGTTVSIPIKNSDKVECRKIIEDNYEKSPPIEGLNFIIDDKLIENKEDWLLLSDNVEVSEDLILNLWVKNNLEIKEKIVSNRMNPSFNVIGFTIGGWVYKNPMQNMYKTGYELILELKPGILSFNSSRDNILKDERLLFLNEKVNNYLQSQQYKENLKKLIEDFSYEDYRKFLTKNILLIPEPKILENGILTSSKHWDSSFIMSSRNKENCYSVKHIIDKVKELTQEQQKIMYFKKKKFNYSSYSDFMTLDTNPSCPHIENQFPIVREIGKPTELISKNREYWLEEGTNNNLESLLLHLSSLNYNSTKVKVITSTEIGEKGVSDFAKMFKKRNSLLAEEKKNNQNISSLEYVFTHLNKNEIEELFKKIFLDYSSFDFIEASSLTPTKKKNHKKAKKEISFNSIPVYKFDENKLDKVWISEEQIQLNNKRKIFLLTSYSVSNLDICLIKKGFCNSHNLQKEEVDFFIVNSTIDSASINIIKEYGEIYLASELIKPRKSKASELHINKDLIKKENFYNDEKNNPIVHFIRTFVQAYGLEQNLIYNVLSVANKFSNKLNSLRKNIGRTEISIEDGISKISSVYENLNFDYEKEAKSQQNLFSDLLCNGQEKDWNNVSLLFSLMINNESYKYIENGALKTEKIPTYIFIHYIEEEQKLTENDNMLSLFRKNQILEIEKIYSTLEESLNKIISEI